MANYDRAKKNTIRPDAEILSSSGHRRPTGLTTPFLFMLCLVFVLFSSNGYSTTREPEYGTSLNCEQLLSTPIEVKIKLNTKSEVSQTIRDSISAFTALSRNNGSTRHAFPEEVLQSHFIFIQSTLWKAHQKQLLIKETKSEQERHDLFTRLMTKEIKSAKDYNEAFNSRYSAPAYSRYFSATQRYFSAMLVGYGFLKAQPAYFENLNILELGCGVGDTTRILRRLLPMSTILAFDKSQHFLNQLVKQKLHEELDTETETGSTIESNYNNSLILDANRFKRGLNVIPFKYDFNKHDIPLPPNSQHWVISISAAAQYSNPVHFQKILLDVMRVLRPGGYFLFEFGPHLQSVPKGTDLQAFLQKMKEFGFIPETSIDMHLQTASGTNIYPILLRKPTLSEISLDPSESTNATYSSTVER